MCTTCGCSDSSQVTFTDSKTGMHSHGDGPNHTHAHDDADADAHAHAHNHVDEHEHPGEHQHAADHSHQHGHSHDHTHDHDRTSTHLYRPAQRKKTRKVTLEEDILAKNQLLAERNRGWLAGRDILALNLMSSPGSGKTTLLERTLTDLKGELAISVIEGDQATANDANRIRATGCDVIQINTGAGCHLDANMLAHGMAQLDPPSGSVVMIENVGNLVCPALFDLGERAKVVILSVTEGEDKPIKYPHMFRASSLMIINKIDLLAYVRFDVERCMAYAREVNPDIEVLRVSAESGEGMSGWYAWVRGLMANARSIRTAREVTSSKNATTC